MKTNKTNALPLIPIIVFISFLLFTAAMVVAEEVAVSQRQSAVINFSLDDETSSFIQAKVERQLGNCGVDAYLYKNDRRYQQLGRINSSGKQVTERLMGVLGPANYSVHVNHRTGKETCLISVIFK